MCIVLDTNAFGQFFDSTNKNHLEFKPVLNWVVSGSGKLVYGGSKYKAEMKEAHKYIKFFTLLDKAGKLVKLNDAKVDNLHTKVRALEPCKKFDDPHLIAIILESKCQIICTNDKRAIPYIKKAMFYPKGIKKPKLYTSKKNIALLCDKYTAAICKPCNRLPKKVVKILEPQFL